MQHNLTDQDLYDLIDDVVSECLVEIKAHETVARDCVTLDYTEGYNDALADIARALRVKFGCE